MSNAFFKLSSGTHKALRKLLLDMFSADGLRRLAFDLDQDLHQAIHWNQPVQDVAFAFVEALVRRGMVNDQLRKALIEEREHRKEEIDQLWSAFQAGAPIAGGPSDGVKTDAGALGPRQAKAPPARASNGPNPSPFDVFISYNSRDRSQVMEVAERLRDRGLRVWLDKWELVPGRPWQDALEEIISTTKTAAVFVGPSGFGPWETPEMRACLMQYVRKQMPVIPVLLKGSPTDVSLPLFLQAFTWVDLRSGDLDDKIDQLEWGITGNKPARRR